MKRNHEMYLIKLGLETLLDGLIKPVKVKKVKVKKVDGRSTRWTAARRAKLAKTMKRKWAAKNKD